MNVSEYSEIKGGVTAAKGFKAASTAAGIKYQGREDMAMIFSETPCECAGTFTRNRVKAACVKWDRELVTSGKKLHAVVINSGIANACTGEEGFMACRKTAAAVNKALGVPEDSVAVASTGVIGMQLPVEKLEKGVEAMSTILSDSIEKGTEASKAIMTTDTVNKETAVRFTAGGKEAVIGGMSKGSGMIHPDMCTMLAFVTTDVSIDRNLMQKAVSEVIDESFNMITVDGDTSTNDTFMLLSNGLAGNEKIVSENEDYISFKNALSTVCTDLAKKMAADGEGATKLFEAEVINAASKKDARTLARAVVSSNLSKAAIFGCDANFGRFLCAMGYSGAEFDEKDVELFIKSDKGEIRVFDRGVPIVFDEDKALDIMKADRVTVFINMNGGSENATAWGCDLTYDYVKINADYRS